MKKAFFPVLLIALAVCLNACSGGDKAADNGGKALGSSYVPQRVKQIQAAGGGAGGKGPGNNGAAASAE